MRILGTLFLSIGLIALCAPAHASDALEGNGAAKLAAYQVCKSLAAIDMGPSGSGSVTECNGIVRNLDSQKLPDNLSIHCIESTNARPEGYKYSGSCVQTDHDGDKLYMTYEGSSNGEIKWVGGTGKFENISGTGSLSVVAAPESAAGHFAYTLTYEVSWTHKPK